jgi:2-amino-4-hydroxy-6-hydroxymethyldihydropteridine diphosphokinase
MSVTSAVIPEDALVVGLGGNVGGEAAIVERFVRAREALGQLGDVRAAPLYRTAAIGPPQDAFLNSAVRVRVPDATPEELIATVLEIERLLGRDRRGEARLGPRTIDLDILVWGTRVLRSPSLEVPHPRVAERRFALAPLVALFGEDVLLPGTQSTLGALEQRVTTQALEELRASW